MINTFAVLTLLAGLAHAAVAAAATDHKFTLITNPLVLPPGQSNYSFKILVMGTNLPIDEKKAIEPLLVDAGTPASPPVTITPPKYKGSDNPKGKNQLLTFEFQVSGFPLSDSQTRAFAISYGDVRETLTYTLTNSPSKGFTWSVKVNAEWNLGSMAAFPIQIKINDRPATKLNLFQADFVSDDKQRHTIALPHFHLSADANHDTPVPDPMFAGQNYTVYIRTDGMLPYGTLKGNLALIAYEKTDPEVLALTIYSPRPYGLPLGLLCLAVGVLVSSFLQLVIRPLIRRNEQRQVVLLLRERLADLKQEFAKLPDNLKTAAEGWSAREKQLETDLSDKSLKDDMPPFIPQAFDDEVQRLETFQTKMTELGNNFTFLRTLLRDGLESVARLQSAHPGHNADMNIAAETISELPPGDSVGDGIAKALTDLRGKIGPAATLAAAPRTAAASIPDEIHQLNVEVAAANLAAFIIWGSVSVLSGALVLILINPAFGTAYDLAVCLAWGMGITAVGAQAGQLTPSTVAGSLGVKLPRANKPSNS